MLTFGILEVLSYAFGYCELEYYEELNSYVKRTFQSMESIIFIE